VRIVPEIPDSHHEAFAFIENLDRLSSYDALTDTIRRALGQFGIEFFAFLTLPRRSENFEDAALAVHEPPELLRAFSEEQYIHISPAIRHCRRTVQPFAWKGAPYDRERETRAAEVVDLVTDFGLSNAIMVPIPGPRGCQGGVWLAGRSLELTALHMPVVHLMALYAFDRLRILASKMPDASPKLTPREREVLTWVAMGKSAWEIGEILGIAKRTIDEHTQTAMKKLGAANRTQAVVIAIRDRLIAL
jgi:LuxR family quorum sensing-dependent transcriptional regulator